MNLFWLSGLPAGEEGVDIARAKPIGPVAELAGHRHGPLLLQHVAHLLLPERTQERRYPTLTAAALEMHARAAEEPQVLSLEAALQEALDRSNQGSGARSRPIPRCASTQASSEPEALAGCGIFCTRSPAHPSRSAATSTRVGSCSEEAK
jgi:hypothetical protein